MRTRSWALVALPLAIGCNRSDVDALGRIGDMLWSKTRSLSETAPQGQILDAIPSFRKAASIDSDAARKIEERFRSEPSLAKSSVQVEKLDGKIRLSGKVENDAVRNRARQIAEEIAGHGNVTNNLEL